MGAHDTYGKTLLHSAFGRDFNSRPEGVRLTHDGHEAGSINIDGTLFDRIAVEVESRVNKQVRGAVLDLILHPCELKLLVLIKAHGNNFGEHQARHILKKFCPPQTWRVIIIQGSGSRPDDFLETDIQILKKCVEDFLHENPWVEPAPESGGGDTGAPLP